MESSTLQRELPSMEITVSNPNSPKSEGEKNRFADLRGVRWRINLGILPSSSSSSIDDLRRVTADCRRRYASLRRRLLVDPHIPKDGSNTPALVMDNPLSQNPDSMWGRFFKNAELEKMVDQDLSRLYPEHGSYFQTPGCQGMLRRILLLWCLRHQEYGYRQGMHELLAPLLYVLHVDLEHLSQVRKLHEDHFTDKFDGLAFEESDLTYNFDFKKFSDSMEDEIVFQGNSTKLSSPGELNPEIQTIVFLSDAYGAEGELGILLSDKFMEHDAYCMFDALMSGSKGAVAMADFFSHSPAGGSHTGYPPVIEASSALYHLLYVVDSSLYSHLVELGVEPQYFALRWLRVLFGREFSLEDLLIIWDEIFTSDNGKSNNSGENGGPGFGILSSARGAFISGLAVSMILQLRASLLATENATSCLQRLLNFPQNSNLKKLLEKAKSLQALALDTKFASLSPSFSEAYNRSSKPVRGHTHSHSTESVSSTNPLGLVPDSYWEEKWRVMQKAEELRQSSIGQQVPSRKKRWTEKVRLSLSRSESDPSPLKVEKSKKDSKSSVRRSLLQDLSRQLDSEEVIEKSSCNDVSGQNNLLIEEIEAEGQNCINNNSTFISEDNCLSGNTQDHTNNKSTFMAEENCMSGNTGSEENSSIFSASNSTSPLSVHNHHHENDLEKSSVASNSSIEYNEDEPNNNTVSFQNILEDPSLQVTDCPDIPEDIALQSSSNKESLDKDKSVVSFKERKPPSGKFNWFWKFGRNGAGEETSEKGGGPVAAEVTEVGSSVAQVCSNSCVGDKGETVDQNVVATLKNLGQSMRENIQVIESVFQHEPIQAGTLENMSRSNIVGKGQVTAMAALKELRKISNLLSEM